MSSEGSSKAVVVLISEDGIKFPVSLPVLRCIGLFKNLLELEGGAGVLIVSSSSSTTPPPLNVPNVTSLILDKIIEYLDNFVSSRDISTVTPGTVDKNKVIAPPLKVKNTIVSAVSNSNNSMTRNIDDDDDDDDYDYDYDFGNKHSSSEQVFMNQECLIEKDSEFEMISDTENEEEEAAAAFDFENFDEQMLRLFTPFEQNFFANLDIPTLIEITKAANYMNIPHLLDSCCKAIANHMKGLSVEELRVKFNIKNDFTPEEEERVRRETAWIDD